MKTVRTACGWLAVLVLVACGGKPAAQRTAPSGGPAPAAEPAPRARGPFEPAAMMADVEWLCAAERRGRGSFTADSAAAAEYVAGAMEAAGLEVIRQSVMGRSVNVIGILRGDDQAVVVSAHHDHVGVDALGRMYPGADDNASGLAVLLALVRDAAHRHFEHTILFISFGAEEEGLIGSGVYVTDPIWPLDRTLAAVNFDMVGRNFFEAGADREHTCAVIGLESHGDARHALEHAADEVGLHLVVAPARLLEVFGYALRTDDWRFRRAGIPAIHFSTGFHDDYHEPTDTPDKLVPEQMSRIARTAAGLLAYLAGRTR